MNPSTITLLEASLYFLCISTRSHAPQNWCRSNLFPELNPVILIDWILLQSACVRAEVIRALSMLNGVDVDYVSGRFRNAFNLDKCKALYDTFLHWTLFHLKRAMSRSFSIGLGSAWEMRCQDSMMGPCLHTWCWASTTLFVFALRQSNSLSSEREEQREMFCSTLSSFSNAFADLYFRKN